MHNDPKPWKTLESIYLHRRPWLTMRQDRVQLANGNTIDDFYVWEYPPWLNIIALTPDEQIILIRQYRHGIGKVLFELPAGVHDRAGESLLQGAQRELLEETGYGGGQWHEWMQLSPNPALQNNISYTFLALGVEKISSQRLDATEEITIHPVSPGEAREIIENGEMLQALHVAPIMKYLLSR
ncbi:MAG: NUDIX hydrolase [Prosthecochloris sp.]|uniref:GDP-mannose pyrophosphatase n=1 Tax=Prosthecochloris aestuarii (strain DSM 271 / SK 413) TaxID=290512 RepID=B4S8X8_PROA2|nr:MULTISPECIES: NUDIX hydrolase [Prosthecochloris]ACF46515.1 NUDIX hydrolase [Prosthecochloris aestuarii DSM 271]MCW8797628.1 NUDIX hydrolase [Prosthecochloris sp.]NEX11840.1 NUDIX hydrolase [Prosthecochloris sp.]